MNIRVFLIAKLVDEKKSIGTYSIIWNANDISSGVYFCRMVTEDFIHTRKIILMK